MQERGPIAEAISILIEELRAEGRKFETTRPDFAKQRFDSADQLERRMSARVPLKGALVFQDSKKKEHERGIDVGQEQEMRSFVEGATETKGSWWPDWVEWLKAQDAAMVAAKGKRAPGGKGDPAIEDAPGRYVKTR